jgi:hypothetical protein
LECRCLHVVPLTTLTEDSLESCNLASRSHLGLPATSTGMGDGVSAGHPA